MKENKILRKILTLNCGWDDDDIDNTITLLNSLEKDGVDIDKFLEELSSKIYDFTYYDIIDEARKLKKFDDLIYAYDPLIDRRVVHFVKDGYAISLVTGHKFKYNKEKEEEKYKEELKDVIKKLLKKVSELIDDEEARK